MRKQHRRVILQIIDVVLAGLSYHQHPNVTLSQIRECTATVPTILLQCIQGTRPFALLATGKFCGETEPQALFVCEIPALFFAQHRRHALDVS